MATTRFPSRSGAELARLLAESPKSDAANAVLGSKIHRTALWRFATFRRRPDADTIALLHRLTNGVVDAAGWGLDSQAAAPTEAA